MTLIAPFHLLAELPQNTTRRLRITLLRLHQWRITLPPLHQWHIKLLLLTTPSPASANLVQKRKKRVYTMPMAARLLLELPLLLPLSV